METRRIMGVVTSPSTCPFNILICVDANGAVRRFHEMKKEWGIAQLLPLETFKNPAFGYLVNDLCFFGVEVFVINYTGNWESISLVKEPNNGNFTWKMENFSNLNEPVYYSEMFNVEGINWKLRVYPNGDSRTKDKSFSFFLTLVDWGSYPMKKAVYAEYNLRVFNQLDVGQHVEKKASCWFKDKTSYGFRSVISWRDLRDASKGYIVTDTLIVEVVFLVISVADVSSSKKQNII
ncbi:hypothetical protein FEM48_Zijuj07G0169200 [Ziziphus jujuba var. spinosa]|uniref:MATH domain-containing protein n=1 Tax=Ziziphus jujuba var. spinosa TaxID=714518 RepID=A0A978V5U5_ZIZJJ|nr:hypothetical protein FEM48_Zijuj07G0169200 [Ziziphus jujuba var. spinosa]